MAAARVPKASFDILISPGFESEYARLEDEMLTVATLMGNERGSKIEDGEAYEEFG